MLTAEEIDAAQDLVITMTDIRKSGHCARGAKQWFDANGIDFRAHLANGTPAPELIATGDGMVLRMIRLTLRRRHGKE